MDLSRTSVCLALKARVELHSLIFNYLNSDFSPLASRRLKKKIIDASRKFFIESLNGKKTLRLKKNPALKVHTSLEEV